MASGYVKCSCSIKNVTTFPPFPELKSFQICFTGETIKDGDFSSAKGLNPFKLLPARFRCTKSPITSSTRAASKTVSMEFCEIKFYILEDFKDTKFHKKTYKVFKTLQVCVLHTPNPSQEGNLEIN